MVIISDYLERRFTITKSKFDKNAVLSHKNGSGSSNLDDSEHSFGNEPACLKADHHKEKIRALADYEMTTQGMLVFNIQLFSESN